MSKQNLSNVCISLFFFIFSFLQTQTAQAQGGNCNPPGVFEGWTQSFGGTTVKAMSVAARADGTVFVVGEFSGTDIDFYPGTIIKGHSSNGDLDIFITKINPDGTYAWTKTIGGNDDDSALKVAIDANGAVYIAGSFYSSPIDFNPYEGVNLISGSTGIFVTKLNPDDSYAWTKVISGGGVYADYGMDMNVDPSGAFFVAGTFVGTHDFDQSSGVDLKTSHGDLDIFVTKFNSDGSYAWTQIVGGIGVELYCKIAIDSFGAVFVVGSFDSDEIDFDPTSGVDIHVNNSTSTFYGYDVFVTKFNSNGSYAWTQTIGGEDGDYGKGIAVDSVGAVFVLGSFNGMFDFDPTAGTDFHFGDIFVTKFTSAGSYDWTRTFGSNIFEANGLVVDSGNAVLITGYFHGSNVDLNPNAGVDLFTAVQKSLYLTKLYSDGSYGWTQVFAETVLNFVKPNSIALDSNDAVYIAGKAVSPGNDTMVDVKQFVQTNVTFFLDCNGNGVLDSCDIGSGISLDINRNGIPDECEIPPDMPEVEGDCNGNGILDSEDIARGTSLDCNNNGFPDECEPLKFYYGWTNVIGDVNSRDLAVDSTGAILILGNFQGSVDFDPSDAVDIHSAAAQDPDVFITKYNANGSYGWTKTFSATSYSSEGGNEVATNADGAVFIVGSFNSSSVDFDPNDGIDLHFNQGSSDIFLTKLNGDGSYSWTKTFGSLGFDSGRAVAVSNSGAIFIAGNFSGGVDFDPGPGIDIHNGLNGANTFITKFNPDGSYAWTKISSGLSTGIVVGSNSDIFVAGYFGASSADFDPEGNGDVHFSQGAKDIFVTKIYGDGSYAWTQTMGGVWDDYANSIALGLNGDVLITGSFYQTVDFDPTNGIDLHTAINSEDVFVSKLGGDGSYLWTRTFGGGSYESGYGVAADSNSNVFVVGEFSSLIADFDPSEQVDNHLNHGNSDIFITKFHPDGSYVWTKTYGGIKGDSATGIALDANSGIFVGGVTYSSVIDFDPTGHMDLYQNGYSSIFVSKLLLPDTHFFADCNGNQIFDGCDIASGTSLDLNQNGVPDECGPLCVWDLNGDGQVGGADLGIFLGAWGTNPGGAPDFNGDGIVNGDDFGQFLGHWGFCP